MEVRFLFKGAPMDPKGNLKHGKRACFSIIPMGLGISDRFGPDLWGRVASQIDLVIEGLARTDPEAETLIRDARVLSFPMTIHVLQTLAEEAASGAEWLDGPAVACAFDFVKEGHTSSVWKTEITLASGTVETYAINVARDAVAGQDLSRSSRMLDVLAKTATGLTVAEPVLIREMEAATGPVVVTVNRWIEGAEVHMVSEDAGDRQGLVEVHDFLTVPGSPGQVSGARCRFLTDAEHGEALRAVSELDAMLSDDEVIARCGGKPDVAVHEGDLVWTGHELAVVALSPTGGGAVDPRV